MHPRPCESLHFLGTLGFLDPMYFILDFDLAFRRLQVWRLVTSLFFFGMFAGPQTFAVLINIYLFTMYSGRLEEGDFKGQYAREHETTTSIPALAYLLSQFTRTHWSCHTS